MEPALSTWRSSDLPLLLGEAEEVLGRRLDGIVAFWSPCTPEEVAGAEEAAAEGAMLEALGWLGAFSLVMPEMPVEGGALFGGI